MRLSDPDQYNAEKISRLMHQKTRGSPHEESSTKQVLSSRLYIVSFDIKGTIMESWLPGGGTVN